MKPALINPVLEQLGTTPLRQGCKLIDLINRPQITIENIAKRLLSFGIGGGPINLVVLFFFFSMSTKIAAENSLYIIFFSQIASLVSTIVSGSVPDFQIGVLILMVAGGIAGGICGRAINKKIDEKTVDKLFIALMVLMIVINIYNIFYRNLHSSCCSCKIITVIIIILLIYTLLLAPEIQTPDIFQLPDNLYPDGYNLL